MDNEILIREARKGDKAAFEKLVQLYQKKIYNYALRLTYDADLSQDLCQEAFIKAFIAIRSFRGTSSFATWIYRILHNTFLDYCRKEAYRYGQHKTDLDDRSAGLQEVEIKRFYERIRHAESSDWLAKGLVQLPVPFRSILILRDIQGLSYEEIAEITNTSEGTVKSRLNRAREQLRRILSLIDLVN